MDNTPTGTGSRVYREPMTLPDMLSVDELAEQLGCAPDEAVALIRRVGPKDVLRTEDRRFLIPAGAVEQLRAALAES